MKVIRLLTVLAVLSVLLLTACASSDTTKVTVYFAKDKQASLEQNKLPLIDRFLNLFTKKAYAQHQPEDTANYFLYITADDMDTVYTPFIDGSYTSISVEVPSGKNRVFTVFSFSPSGNYNYVGQNTANLTGGNTSISINMYPCLNNIIVTNSGYMYINWTYDSTLDDKYPYVKIYRACYGTDPSCDGTITTLTTTWPFGTGGTGTYPDMDSFIEGNFYYYFLSVDTGSFANGGLIAPTNFSDFFTNYNFIAVYMMGEYYVPVTAASWVGTWLGTTTSTCGYYSGSLTFNITSTGGNGLNFAWSTPSSGSGSYTGTFSGNTATSDNGNVIFYVNGHTLISTEADSCQTGTFSNNF
ncbi:MAG: hypothetical protein V1874_10575 [Spirochaetota bacterium]